MRGYAVKWKGRAFGERLVTSLFVHILRDNGIDAVFANNTDYYKRLVDCPFYDTAEHRGYKVLRLRTAKGKDRLQFGSILGYLANRFNEYTGIQVDINTGRNYIPVRYYDIDSISGVDVSFCTNSGGWTPYRNWPYFGGLKEKLDSVGISYVDLTRTRGIETLNHVNKSRLYVGLETGTSHYVSQVANGKALIIQSGYTSFDFWASMYDYDSISVEVDCSGCLLNKYDIYDGKECEYDHKCMRDISVDMVFDYIEKRLGG